MVPEQAETPDQQHWPLLGAEFGRVVCRNCAGL